MRSNNTFESDRYASRPHRARNGLSARRCGATAWPAAQLIAIVLVATLCAVHVHAREITRDEELRLELLEMQRIDQRARNPSGSGAFDILAIDRRHTARLRDIIVKYGWPTISLVGEDGARAAWLLAQHADDDPAFQREVLRLMESLVAKGEVSASLYAYLYDRTHKPQKFGTQGACTGSGVWTPREIEDPENVDQRRAEVGMFPAKLSEYAKFTSGLCK